MRTTDRRTDIVLDALQNRWDAQWCSYYGEPGYSDPARGVILANWNDIPKWVGDYLEAAGFECEWSDEWWIDSNRDKAYRTEPSSYGWRPTAVLAPEECDYLTPDDGAAEAIEAFASECAGTVSAVPYWVTDEDLEEAGFVQHEGRFERGFHPGQTDDPVKIARALLDGGKAHRVVGRIDESGQFDVRFSMWFEPVLVEEDA